MNYNKIRNVKNNMNENNFKKLIIGSVLGLLGLITLLSSFTIVSPGERGVKVTLGKASDTVLEEGFHLKAPFISRVEIISVRIQKTESKSEAATKDLQRVGAVLALNWNLDPKLVNQMFKSVGDERAIAERIINPAVSEVLKAATAKMTAEEVLTKRLELKQTIDEMLVKRLNAYNIIVKDISLVDLDFTEQCLPVCYQALQSVSSSITKKSSRPR